MTARIETVEWPSARIIDAAVLVPPGVRDLDGGGRPEFRRSSGGEVAGRSPGTVHTTPFGA